ncbi:MAG: hypothetical protein WBW33_29760 [Bryobacteraceae bacterium]
MGGRPFGDWLRDIEQTLPLRGDPVLIDVQPELTASRGKLLSGEIKRGYAVHAASFIRKRAIVLECELLKRKRLLGAILVHELFHFVWVRCGNECRRNYCGLLREEILRKARGELGESAETWKNAWRQADGGQLAINDHRWREYVCESFCDTAAWYLSDERQRLPVTLANRWQTKRAKWFEDWLELEGNGLRA